MSGEENSQSTQPGSLSEDLEAAPVESPELGPEALEALQLISGLDRIPSSEYVTELRFCEAHQLLEFLLKGLTNNSWVFRGHRNANWSLQPTAERCVKDRHAPTDDHYILSAFKRRAHQYLTDLPATDDYLEWLALAQHYGAPTSLLDFTTSPYVAAFFAVAEQGEEECAAVWAIEIDPLRSGALQQLRISDDFFNTVSSSLGSPEVFKRLFPRSHRSAAIVPLRPERMNERLTVQQGLFLYPTSFWNFELTLKITLHSWCDYVNAEWPRRGHLYKLIIEPDARLGVLKELNRMNVTYASLFPGLEGFARSLRTNAVIRDCEGPDYGFHIHPRHDGPI